VLLVEEVPVEAAVEALEASLLVLVAPCVMGVNGVFGEVGEEEPKAAKGSVSVLSVSE
jgi:hypothetical protein